MIKNISSNKTVDDKSGIDLKPSFRSVKLECSYQGTNFPKPFKSEPEPFTYQCNDSEFGCKLPPTTKQPEQEFNYDEEAFEKYYEEKMLKERMPIDQEILLENMREDHNLRLKDGVLMGVRAEEGIRVNFLLINLLKI